MSDEFDGLPGLEYTWLSLNISLLPDAVVRLLAPLTKEKSDLDFLLELFQTISEPQGIIDKGNNAKSQVSSSPALQIRTPNEVATELLAALRVICPQLHLLSRLHDGVLAATNSAKTQRTRLFHLIHDQPTVMPLVNVPGLGSTIAGTKGSERVGQRSRRLAFRGLDLLILTGNWMLERVRKAEFRRYSGWLREVFTRLVWSGEMDETCRLDPTKSRETSNTLWTGCILTERGSETWPKDYWKKTLCTRLDKDILISEYAMCP
ncbi:unnamed protein product [Protopolystoma xenopodis]|uniref:Uncharacterized protein n=1 Tax=Protopolystoma xenopodis TaxID=117903 RepID=A0A3S4ZUE3_9PLAT|nr:unnamed protein product [Protopolystoma xenopodis]